MKQSFYIFIIVFVFCASPFVTCNAQNKPFTLVIDAGHGGKDPGAMGKLGREKDVTLKVALLTGKMIKEKHPDIKIIYTRQTDKFVKLSERPKIANRNDGDFFISIHVNGNDSKQPYGTETYILGLHKSKANLEVAKRENAVMLLDDDKEAYSGFDPKSPDSYIIFELSQSKYETQSLELADYIQKEFTAIKRHNRSVRQAGFWVLHQVSMPSVLVELGFITNVNEEKYLISSNGQKQLSQAIAKAFDKYKHEYDKKTSKKITVEKIKEKEEPKKNTASSEKKKEEVKKVAATNSDIVFRLQIFAVGLKLPDSHAEIKKVKGYPPVKYTQVGKLYKYTCGESANYDDIVEIKKQLRNKFPDAMIVAFKKGKQITVKEAIKGT